MMAGMGKVSCCDGWIDPLPTMLRDVSGRNSIIIVKHDPEAMHKNQNIQGQPAANVRPPPRIGPMLGAIVILVSVSASFQYAGNQTYAKDTKAAKDPLSAGDATSATTPYAIENVPGDISAA